MELFRGAIRTLSNILAIRSITDDDIKYANNSPINDYEDAAQLSCALRRGCDAIVTSDKKYNKYTKVKTYTVEAFYDLIFKQ